MKHTKILVIALALLVGVGLAAHAQNAEANVFGIELGQVIGYNFGTEEVGVGQLMGIHFGMTDDMEVGFLFISGDGGTPPDMPSFGLVRMSYFMSETFGMQLSTGNSGGAMVAGGLGAFVTPFRRTVDEMLTTSLRLSVDYLLPDLTTDIAEGILALGITGKIAF